MNLLSDDWIPVRSQKTGASRQISLQTLFCYDKKWELALPRDDMEFAALQLLICLAQVLFPPKDKKEWAERIASLLPIDVLKSSVSKYQDWFKLDHPKYPFMQMKTKRTKIKTPMDKLLTGIDTSENSRFVNERGLADSICSGCAAIALFNYASNSPSFGGGPGGGFKYGIRGTCAVSTYTYAQDLRSTVWINVLTQEFLNIHWENWKDTDFQPPTWVNYIPEGKATPSTKIDLLRGLFWQPGCLELNQTGSGKCACCNNQSLRLYDSFGKAPYGFSVDGFWGHPHSPQSLTIKKNKKGKGDCEYLRWVGSMPAWTQLSGFIVERIGEIRQNVEQQQRPALIIKQLRQYLGNGSDRLHLLVGGYKNYSAKVIERRHEMLVINQGWGSHVNIVHELVLHALKYGKYLADSLYVFSVGLENSGRKLKGVGLTYKDKKATRYSLQESARVQFYRRTESLVLRTLANIDFENTAPTYNLLDSQLKTICELIFEELTSPYNNDPALFRMLTITRRSLQKHMKEICINSPEKDAA